MEGVLTQISIGQESAWGTAVTPTVSLPVNPSDGISPKAEPVGVEAIKGTPAKNKAFFKGKASYEGSFEMGLYPNAIGYLLKSAIGSVSETTPEASVYIHTFAEAVTKPSLTVEQNMANYVKRFAGFVADGFKISGKAGEGIMFAVTGQAKTSADATAITAAYETRRPLSFADVKTLSIAGTDIKAKVEDFEIEYKNDLNMFYGLGSVDPAGKYVKASEVTGKLTMYLDSATKSYLADLIALTEREVILEIEGDLVGATLKDNLKITLSKCAMSKFETKIDTDYNAISLEFVCREDTTNGLLKVVLQNGVAAY